MSKFSKIHTAIIGTFKTAKVQADKLLADSTTKQNAEIQKLVDAHLLACTTTKAEYLKGNSVKNDARREVKELFESLAKAEYISQKSATQYQTCFWIAFETGVPFARDLVNVKAKAKAESTKAESTKAESVKAGAVTTTTIAEMHKTLSKALAQARTLNQSIFAAELIDFILITYPDFKETVLGK
jgi:hypothetical protein